MTKYLVIFLLAWKLVQGRLAINCVTTAETYRQKVTEVRCPAGCIGISSNIWGTTVYTDDSFICAAAIHDGVIANEGGNVTVFWEESPSSYQGTTQNGVTTKSYGDSWTKAYRFSGSCYQEGKHVKAVGAVTRVWCPAGCQTVSQRLWGSSVYTSESYVCAAAIHDGRLTDAGGFVDVFFINGFLSYDGDFQHGITSKAFNYFDSSFAFEDLCQKRGHTIASFPHVMRCPSGCDNTDKLWGTDIYSEGSYICSAAVHAGAVTASGGVFQVFKYPGLTTYRGSYQKGITSNSYGSWTSSFGFLDMCGRRGDHSSVDFTITCPPGCQDNAYQVWGSTVYTDRSSVCAAAIHSGVIQGATGGVVMVHKLEGLCEYSASSSNGINSVAYNQADASFAFGDISACLTTGDGIQPGGVITVECPPGCDKVTCKLWGSGPYASSSYVCAAAIHNGLINAGVGGSVAVRSKVRRNAFLGSTRNGISSRTRYGHSNAFGFTDSCNKTAQSETASSFDVLCPPGCADQDYDIWGSRVFTHDSYICASAIHSGALTNEGGKVTVYKVPGLTSYLGSVMNGITSKSYGPWSSSFVFRDLCTMRGHSVLSESSQTIQCPPGCSLFVDRLWGTGAYTHDSYVCVAAIHNGILTDDGGEVTFYNSGERSNFPASIQNGITSKSYQGSFNSFIFTDPSACQETAEGVIREKTVVCPAGCHHFTDRLWGSGPYTDTSYICAAAIHSGKITADGGTVTIQVTPGLSQYFPSLRNAILSKPYGLTRKAFEFQDNCEKSGSVISGNFAVVQCPPGCARGLVWGTVFFSEDSSICSAAIHYGQITANTGGRVTVYKTVEMNRYKGSVSNGINSQDKATAASSFAFFDICDMVGSSLSSSKTVLPCPANCQGNSPVVGTDVYHDTSKVCAAAIHDGRIDVSGGLVVVYKSPLSSQYNSRIQHGITSLGKVVSYGGSFLFHDTCQLKGDGIPMTRFSLMCVPGCDRDPGFVFGSDVYTDDSYVCAAAIHDGKIRADVGGMVHVKKYPGRRNYVGSTRYGITSNDFTNWHRSMRFRNVSPGR